MFSNFPDRKPEFHYTKQMLPSENYIVNSPNPKPDFHHTEMCSQLEFILVPICFTSETWVSIDNGICYWALGTPFICSRILLFGVYAWVILNDPEKSSIWKGQANGVLSANRSTSHHGWCAASWKICTSIENQCPCQHMSYVGLKLTVGSTFELGFVDCNLEHMQHVVTRYRQRPWNKFVIWQMRWDTGTWRNWIFADCNLEHMQSDKHREYWL